MKIKIVELELEKATSEQEHEVKRKELQKKFSQLEESYHASNAKLSDQIRRLEAEVEEVRDASS